MQTKLKAICLFHLIFFFLNIFATKKKYEKVEKKTFEFEIFPVELFQFLLFEYMEKKFASGE